MKMLRRTGAGRFAFRRRRTSQANILVGKAPLLCVDIRPVVRLSNGSSTQKGRFVMVLEKKYCQNCGRKFYSKHPKQRYCSNRCQWSLPAHRRLLECPICHHFYVPRNKAQSTCSKRCYQKYLERNFYTRGRFIIFERDGFTCIYCGRSSYDDSAELHADHVIPRKEGGLDVAGNLVTSCQRCNLEKSSHPLHNPDPILRQIHKRNQALRIVDDQIIALHERQELVLEHTEEA